MSPIVRLNLMLSAALVLLVGVNAAIFSYPYWPKSKASRDPTAGEYPVSECLKVSDFYSVHLTTYFLAGLRGKRWGTNR